MNGKARRRNIFKESLETIAKNARLRASSARPCSGRESVPGGARVVRERERPRVALDGVNQRPFLERARALALRFVAVDRGARHDPTQRALKLITHPLGGAEDDGLSDAAVNQYFYFGLNDGISFSLQISASAESRLW